MPLHVEAWRQYLAERSIPVDDLETAMHGKRNSELVRTWFGDELAHETVLEHGAAKEQLWRELIAAEGLDRYQIAGLEDFLDRYPDIPKAVGSNAEPLNIEFVLEGLGIRRYFSAVVNGYQVTHAKPAPDIYLKCAELVQAEPARCIVFEDSPVGIQAARSAGMRVVGITTTASALENVDLEVSDFSDPRLHDWIAAL